MAIDLFSDQVHQNPYPVYAELRRRQPVYYDRTRNVWFVARYADIVGVLRDGENFSKQNLSLETTLSSADGPAHGRVRNMVTRAFTTQMIGLEKTMRSLANELAQRIGNARECEIMDDLAMPLAASFTAEILGIELSRTGDIRRWSHMLFREGNRPLIDPQAADLPKEIDECRAFVRTHLSRTADGSAGGLFSGIVGKTGSAEKLTLDEATDVGTLLIIASNETTARLIGNAAVLLARHPKLQEQLRAQIDLIPAFVEEMLRYDTPLQRIARVTKYAIPIGTVTIPKGALVKALVGSANRDPGAFPDADQFCIGRQPNRHVSFGLGAHFCLGAQAARFTAAAALEALILQQPAWVLARPGHPVEYKPGFDFRGPHRLPLAFP